MRACVPCRAVWRVSAAPKVAINISVAGLLQQDLSSLATHSCQACPPPSLPLPSRPPPFLPRSLPLPLALPLPRALVSAPAVPPAPVPVPAPALFPTFVLPLPQPFDLDPETPMLGPGSRVALSMAWCVRRASSAEVGSAAVAPLPKLVVLCVWMRLCIYARARARLCVCVCM